MIQRARLRQRRAVVPGHPQFGAGLPAREIRFRDLTFSYRGGANVLEGFDLTIPAGSSFAIVGQNGAGKTTMAKLLCRLCDPQAGAIEIDGIDVREFDLGSWRSRLTAVFQDFTRFELPLRDNVAPAGAPDAVVRAALESAGAADLAALDTVLAKGYERGTDLSGGQWQRSGLAHLPVPRVPLRPLEPAYLRRVASPRLELEETITSFSRRRGIHQAGEEGIRSRH